MELNKYLLECLGNGLIFIIFAQIFGRNTLTIIAKRLMISCLVVILGVYAIARKIGLSRDWLNQKKNLNIINK